MTAIRIIHGRRVMGVEIKRFKVWGEGEPEPTASFPYRNAEDAATRVAGEDEGT